MKKKYSWGRVSERMLGDHLFSLSRAVVSEVSRHLR